MEILCWNAQKFQLVWWMSEGNLRKQQGILKDPSPYANKQNLETFINIESKNKPTSLAKVADVAVKATARVQCPEEEVEPRIKKWRIDII